MQALFNNREPQQQMTLDFQKNILRYLYQRKESKIYTKILHRSIFDIQLYQVCFDILQGYVEEYDRVPNQLTAIAAFDQEAVKQEINEESYNEVVSILKQCFLPIELDEVFAKNAIIDFAKKQLIKKVFEDNADKLTTADDQFYRKINSELSKIVNLGADDVETYEGKYLLKDYGKKGVKPIKGHPTYLKKLNELTSAKGFHKPQLVVIMADPKGFKTGIALNLAVNYVRDGFKVYYADGENSVDSISNRSYQCMLACTRDELSEGVYKKELDSIITAFEKLGGEMRTDYYPAHVSTLNDVEENLMRLKEEDGFIPDIIIYDYLDLFASADKTIKEKRLIIQSVYHHAIRINNKLGTFAFTLSQISKKFMGQETIDITAFSEDIGKAHNCHAAFGIVGTPEERSQGFARIIPVAQREGVRFSDKNQCPIVLDEARMSVEYDEEYWTRSVNNKLGAEEGTKKPESTYSFGKNRK